MYKRERNCKAHKNPIKNTQIKKHLYSASSYKIFYDIKESNTSNATSFLKHISITSLLYIISHQIFLFHSYQLLLV